MCLGLLRAWLHQAAHQSLISEQGPLVTNAVRTQWTKPPHCKLQIMSGLVHMPMSDMRLDLIPINMTSIESLSFVP